MKKQSKESSSSKVRHGVFLTNQVLAELDAEIGRSLVHGPTYASLHEAYAVLLEEVDEVWDEVRKKRKLRNASGLREELIQVAAVAIKAIYSMEKFV